MAKPKLITTLIITVEHEKPIPDLVDLIAGRAYTIQGVTNTTASLMGDVISVAASHGHAVRDQIRVFERDQAAHFRLAEKK